MEKITTFLIPIIVLFIISYGLLKKINIYDSFIVGAKEGLLTAFRIFPFIMAMIFAVNLFLESGIINYLFQKINQDYVDLIPMFFLRPISGTASLVLLNNILATIGPDSITGRIASVVQGCTDTTLYIIALYFGSIGITKTRYALGVGLFADFCSIIASILVVFLFFY